MEFNVGLVVLAGSGSNSACDRGLFRSLGCRTAGYRLPRKSSGNPVSVKEIRAEIRCQFIILAREDEPTPDYAFLEKMWS